MASRDRLPHGQSTQHSQQLQVTLQCLWELHPLQRRRQKRRMMITQYHQPCLPRLLLNCLDHRLRTWKSNYRILHYQPNQHLLFSLEFHGTVLKIPLLLLFLHHLRRGIAVLCQGILSDMLQYLKMRKRVLFVKILLQIQLQVSL